MPARVCALQRLQLLDGIAAHLIQHRKPEQMDAPSQSKRYVRKLVRRISQATELFAQ